MSIQILGLRERLNQETSKYQKYDAFFANNWRAPSVDEVLKNPDKVLEPVPNNERVNLYFTVAHCFETKGRKLQEQHVIPYDIDNLAGTTRAEVLANAREVSKIACEALGLHWEHTGILFSGNGVQMFVKIPKPIMAEDFFDTMREHYKATCDKIQQKLVASSIRGNVDPSVFSKGRLMRMPNTLNRKPDKEARMSEVIQANLEAQDFSLTQVSGLEEFQKSEYIHHNAIKNYVYDTKAVLGECEFLRWNFESPDAVNEPAWYAALSIVARLPAGTELSHEMSGKAKTYEHDETEHKIQQALVYGPRTCKDISTRWDHCKKCKHWGTDLKSPAMIRGPDFIKSKGHGFRTQKVVENQVVSGKPEYEDIIRQFGVDAEYMVSVSDKTVLQFDGKKLEPILQVELEAWLDTKLKPKASASEASELYSRLLRTKHQKTEWFLESTEHKVNFQNCVLDLNTMKTMPHGIDFGFTHVLPYNYDPQATCPKFDKFMFEVCAEDKGVVHLLEEFAGYAIAGGDCTACMALILVGHGANGKSVFAETIKKAVGTSNFSSVRLNDLKDDQKVARLHRKLCNISGEASVDALSRSDVFKDLVDGGTATAKILYRDPFEFRNKAKFIVLCNKMPTTMDTSHGFHRRILPVPFDRLFEGATDNKNLKYELEEELPGIYNRFIDGALRLKARQFKFNNLPLKISKMINAYRVDNQSPVEHFCLEHTSLQQDSFVPNVVAFKEYVSWSKSLEEKPMSIRAFMRDMRGILERRGVEFDVGQRIEGSKFKGMLHLKITHPFHAGSGATPTGEDY